MPIIKGLSAEKIAEFRCLFDLFDEDCDGIINITDVGLVLQQLGQTPSEADLKEMIKEVDQNGKGYIEFNEFLGFMASKLVDNDSEEELIESYKIFDRDGDGFINKKDFTKMMQDLEENFSQEEIEEIISDWDEDCDGKLSLDEFKNMMTFR
jgi:calmodulin